MTYFKHIAEFRRGWKGWGHWQLDGGNKLHSCEMWNWEYNPDIPLFIIIIVIIIIIKYTALLRTRTHTNRYGRENTWFNQMHSIDIFFPLLYFDAAKIKDLCYVYIIGIINLLLQLVWESPYTRRNTLVKYSRRSVFSCYTNKICIFTNFVRLTYPHS